LTGPEKETVLETLHSPQFIDKAPAAVWAELLDQGQYLCSIRTMYRLLAERLEVKERRRQRRHPQYAKPELLAAGPNQCWSWDITKLKGPVKWSYFHLYVVLDIFSRYVVGWMVATQENSGLAKTLIAHSCSKQQIEPGNLTIHADRGSSMASKPIALLLADLGITKSHSRPHVCDDNPFSEAQFKTLKYRPEFPTRFGTIQQARTFCREFFEWYNRQHRHSGIGLHTPEDVHYRTADSTRGLRAQVLEAAHQRFPERFPNGKPVPPALPKEVWINPPKKEDS
jgi:putative transposase